MRETAASWAPRRCVTRRASLSCRPIDTKKGCSYTCPCARTLLCQRCHASRNSVLCKPHRTYTGRGATLAPRHPHPFNRNGVSALSGGNQQKVILSRALLARANLVLAEEPTAGVDVGARSEIYRILREVASSGTPIVIVSSDIVELEGTLRSSRRLFARPSRRRTLRRRSD